MSIMILDAGNSIIKAKVARKEQGEITFPTRHPATDRNRVCQHCLPVRNEANMQDYLRINGQPYAVGESAERQGLVTQ